ncbi:hypothetical protein [Carboxylicivirga linearis]|uniref:Uncharacterized protein n=1 Tax=Carboxylicivirga linearis TaxID=1628157 RepID=A0ABS5JQP1_9BACT|nr:hypothetical protein [Carboxylicivirga linearis]MBS2097077.1 hypothetical protein [Carboxylicivirga linearis]
MNNTENRVSAELTIEVREEIKTLLNNVIEKMPFLQGLSADDRKRLPKMDSRNKDFVVDAVNAIKSDTNILPAYIKPDEMTKDLELYEALEEILVPLTYLYDKVRDTQMLAGSEAYSTSLLVYNMAKTAGKAGVPGAQSIYNQLKERFSRNGGKGQTES